MPVTEYWLGQRAELEPAALPALPELPEIVHDFTRDMQAAMERIEREVFSGTVAEPAGTTLRVEDVQAAVRTMREARDRRAAEGIVFATTSHAHAIPMDWEAYNRQVEEALAVQAKGEILLKEWLTAQQRETYEFQRYFDVVGNATGTRYRLREGLLTEVLSRNGRAKHRLCFGPKGGLCLADVMLAQKIALESDEENTLKVANVLDLWMNYTPVRVALDDTPPEPARPAEPRATTLSLLSEVFSAWMGR